MSVLTMDVRADGVAVLTYDVPGEPVNTLKTSFADELDEVLDRVEADPDIRAAILVSGKADAFIAGADVTMLKAVTTAAEAEALARRGHKAVERLAGVSKPIVAAVHGAALGGGLEVALACRARVLSDDRRTVLALPEVQLGIIPGLHGLQMLADLVGLQRAIEHGTTGKNVRPRAALRLGIADDVVPEPILRQVAIELALKLAGGGAQKKRPAFSIEDDLARAMLEGNPVGRRVLFRQARAQILAKTGGHYPAAERVLDVLRAHADGGLEASREVEARVLAELVVSETARRLMEVFFATTALKRDRGIDEPGVEPREVGRVVVLGAGLMGSGIALVSLVAGMTVRLRDTDDAAIARGLRAITRLLDERVKKMQMTPFERDDALGRLTTTTDDAGLAAVDLVIEAVFEDLALKQQVVRDFGRVAREGAIFASNTSSLPVGRIAEASPRPANVVGMHYFSPVQKMPLLEVVRAAKTAPDVVATAVAVGKRQGKTVIVVNDGVGFYTTRILVPYMNEAAWLVMEGAPVGAIDRALVAWGWPVGPMALLDEVGIDVAAHVGAIMREAFGDRIDPPPAIERLMADGRKGRKNERGLYLYPGKKRRSGKEVDESVYPLLGLEVPDAKARPAIAVEEMQMRCSLQLVNEALRCLGEGVLRSPRDGDIGALFGLGFPAFRGGPFRYVDALGAGEVLRRIEGYEQRFGARWAPAALLVEAARSNRRIHG